MICCVLQGAWHLWKQDLDEMIDVPWNSLVFVNLCNGGILAFSCSMPQWLCSWPAHRTGLPVWFILNESDTDSAISRQDTFHR